MPQQMGTQPLHYDGEGHQPERPVVGPKRVVTVDRPVTADAVRPAKPVEPMQYAGEHVKRIVPVCQA